MRYAWVCHMYVWYLYEHVIYMEGREWLYNVWNFREYVICLCDIYMSMWYIWKDMCGYIMYEICVSMSYVYVILIWACDIYMHIKCSSKFNFRALMDRSLCRGLRFCHMVRHMYVYINMHICVIHVWKCMIMYVYVCMYVYQYSYRYICTYTYIYMYMYEYIYTYIKIYIHICTYICIYIHIHIYVYTSIYMFKYSHWNYR